jgi:hypothetical protein
VSVHSVRADKFAGRFDAVVLVDDRPAREDLLVVNDELVRSASPCRGTAVAAGPSCPGRRAPERRRAPGSGLPARPTRTRGPSPPTPCPVSVAGPPSHGQRPRPLPAGQACRAGSFREATRIPRMRTGTARPGVFR